MSVLLTGGIIGGIIGGLGAAYYSIIKKPHGFVEFKTGLVLKFTPEFKAGSNLINLRNAYDDISLPIMMNFCAYYNESLYLL